MLNRLANERQVIFRDVLPLEAVGLVNTWNRDRLGILGAVGEFLF